MILPAQTIRRLCTGERPYRTHPDPMISPFCERTVHNGVTHGLSTCGYDLRVAEDVNLYPGTCVNVDALERFCMPNDVMGVLLTKSTWARLHIMQFGTVIDPGWRGHFRLEIGMWPNAPAGPVNIMAGTGFAHVIFIRLEEPTEQPYEGRYQDQDHNQNAIFAFGGAG